MRIHVSGFPETAILSLALGAGVIEAGMHPAVVRAQQAVASGKCGAAGAHVEEGERLAAQEREMLQKSVTDPRGKDLVTKASGR